MLHPLSVIVYHSTSVPSPLSISHLLSPKSYHHFSQTYIYICLKKNTFKLVLRPSKINSPKIQRYDNKTSRMMALTDNVNHSLIYGFIRGYYEYQIPSDIIGFICMFSNEALLHCIRVDKHDSQHFVISVFDVLQ